MKDKFGDRFRIKSGRRKDWDYSSSGKYFITICTMNHNNFFGNICGCNMEYSQKGLLAYKFIVNIPIHFKNINLIKYIIMPNHVHILMEFSKIKMKQQCRDAINRVSTKTEKMQINNPMKKFNLGTIVRWYKAKVTKEIRNNNLFFAWQSRYYDEIILSKERLRIVKYYIKNNPKNWEKDTLFR